MPTKVVLRVVPVIIFFIIGGRHLELAHKLLPHPHFNYEQILNFQCSGTVMSIGGVVFRSHCAIYKQTVLLELVIIK